jgi:CRP-like cAMP-binding protein
MMLINSLLFDLPRTRGESRFPGLKRVDLSFGQVLHDPGKRIAHVYFPIGSLVSLLSRVKGLKPVELGIVGSDGIVGLSVALGDDVSAVRAVVQAAGPAMRASPADFMRAFGQRKALRRDVYRYGNDLMTQVMQTASCNRNHDVKQRLARWLLMMGDRRTTGAYELTQIFLGYMLGARRAAVSEAAGLLQRKRLIRYSRGIIEILDVRGLRAAACSCYRRWNGSVQA